MSKWFFLSMTPVFLALAWAFKMLAATVDDGMCRAFDVPVVGWVECSSMATFIGIWCLVCRVSVTVAAAIIWKDA